MIAFALIASLFLITHSFVTVPVSGYSSVQFYPIRIVGGTAASANEFPYQVSIRYYGNHICGGSIIGQSEILTAAHCILSTSTPAFTIKAGALLRVRSEPSTNQIRSVSRIISHPDYASTGTKNDIAILKLSSPLTFGLAVDKINLPDAGTEFPAGTNAVATGWGKTTENGQVSDNLLKVNLPVSSQSTCKQVYGSRILDSMLCAGGADGKDTCQGDSGGPLATAASGTRTLIGITSFGRGCARRGSPGVYSKVSYFRTWIKTQSGV